MGSHTFKSVIDFVRNSPLAPGGGTHSLDLISWAVYFQINYLEKCLLKVPEGRTIL
jgi:hypothetical protein